ncbi:MAG TPA: hypothetical protein VFP48_01660, partial [Steroidobacteraceae bacterium]|nr:hypothetical protein [Steroidobacteraceae bacterium]
SSVALNARDIRKSLLLLRDDAWIGLPVRALGDGVVRISPGASVSFTRASSDWAYDPASGKIVQFSDNQDPYTEGGRLCFGASTAYVIRDAFKDGAFTGWTSNGTGTGGSAIATNSDVDPWDENTGITQCAQITAGTPHSVDTYLQSTATVSLPASGSFWLSIWHKVVSGDPLYYTLQRGSDSNYYTESTRTWGAGVVWNPLSDPGGGAWGRYIPTQGITGANSTTLTMRIGYPNAATDGSVGRVYCAMIEDGKVPSWAPIITTTAAVTRAASTWSYVHNPTKVWEVARGAFACEVRWAWPGPGSGNSTIAWLPLGPDNWEWIYWDATNTRWVFERKVATTVYRATYSGSVTYDTDYKIVARWTGSHGELGLTPFTASIFVNGVKGTDVTTGAAPTDSGGAGILELGSKSGAEHLNGRIRLIRSLQWVPNDEEVGRMPL